MNWKDREDRFFSADFSLDKILGRSSRCCFSICVLNAFHTIYCRLKHAESGSVTFVCESTLKTFSALKKIHTGVRTGVVFTLGLGQTEFCFASECIWIID